MLRIYDRPFGFRFLTKSTAKHFVFAYAPADTLMVCDAINVFCEGTVTFVGTTFTVVRCCKARLHQACGVVILREERKLKR